MEDDRFVPADLKMVYKILKSCGYLPPEIEESKEVKKLEELIARTEDEHTRLKQMRVFSLMKVEGRRDQPANIGQQDSY